MRARVMLDLLEHLPSLRELRWPLIRLSTLDGYNVGHGLGAFVSAISTLSALAITTQCVGLQESSHQKCYEHLAGI